MRCTLSSVVLQTGHRGNDKDKSLLLICITQLLTVISIAAVTSSAHIHLAYKPMWMLVSKTTGPAQSGPAVCRLFTTCRLSDFKAAASTHVIRPFTTVTNLERGMQSRRRTHRRARQAPKTKGAHHPHERLHIPRPRSQIQRSSSSI